jgi:hypothetical protein
MVLLPARLCCGHQIERGSLTYWALDGDGAVADREGRVKGSIPIYPAGAEFYDRDE